MAIAPDTDTKFAAATKDVAYSAAYNMLGGIRLVGGRWHGAVVE